MALTATPQPEVRREVPHDALNPKTRLTTQTSAESSSTPRRAARTNLSGPAPASSLTWESDGKDVPYPASERDGLFVPVEAPSPLVNHNVLPKVSRSTALLKTLKALRTMDDFMSDSPTQSNEGRSYEQYREYYDRGIASSQQANDYDHSHPHDSGPNRESQVSRISSSHEHRTLHEDETGAVKFEWNPPEYDADEEGAANEDKDFADLPLSTSQPAPKSQPQVDTSAIFGRYSMPASTMPPPETPTVAQRLFQKDASPSNIMNPSQMFMQTQFTSGVKKLASPTSSRPSPMVFEHNTISPNAVSSPLKDRGLRTSPPTQGFATSPAYRIPETSSKLDEQGNVDPSPDLETIPGSPDESRPKQKTRPEPIGDYAPIRDSPMLENETATDNEARTESDSDDSQERRRLARLKQERANKSLKNITFPRQTSKENIEVPSTNHKQPKTLSQSIVSVLSSPDDVAKQCHGKCETSKDDSQETVADSQEGKVNAATCAVPADSGLGIEDGPVNLQPSTEPELPPAPIRSNETTGSKETIPETSPAGNKRVRKSASAFIKGSLVDKRPMRSSGRISRTEKPSSDESRALPSSPPIPIPLTLFSQTSSARRSSRLRDTVTPAPASESYAGEGPPTTSSTLTVLSETPHLSSSSTPGTETAEQNGRPKVSPAIDTTVSSPAAAKNLRKKPMRLKSYRSPSTRGSTRSNRMSRQESLSTDELAPSTPTSASNSRASRSLFRKSVNDSRQFPSSAGIFHGMTFATSFQSENEKKAVEKMITGAGGNIIPRGFDELFEVGPLESDQSPGLKHGHSTGFTALITDTHSRKPKYMQALALGLPCLSWKWISNCVRTNTIVDWSIYLLCAGQSQVLGAIRSRSLDWYDARNANLDEIIGKRSLLLSNAKVLLVIKKTKKEEEKRLQYLFLAQILGASLVRVGTLEEARAELKKKEEADDSFDWVYVGGLPVDAEKILFGWGQPATKKRKRQSTSEDTDDPPPKRVRTLNDELLVQSLILGRIIEDGEMQDALP